MASRSCVELLEEKALQRALAPQGQALGTSDVAIAASEDVERLRGEQASTQSIRTVALQLANEDAAPLNPFSPQVPAFGVPFRYQLPATAAVTEGLASVNESGVRSRGLTLATPRGTQITAPADG